MTTAKTTPSKIAPTVGTYHNASHEWVRQFDCRDVRPLIVCRGPVRLEAIETFKAMGLSRIGMLLSDKDSTIYEDCVAPERFVLPPECVHLIDDYQAGPGQSRTAHIRQIMEIAQNHGYDAIFAGYGFMAEAADFVQAIADAGLMFIGPSAPVVARAGQKDDAKALARRVGVSITPGVDDLAPRALLSQMGGEKGLLALAEKLGFSKAWFAEQSDNVAASAALLARGRERAEALLDFTHLAAQAVMEIKTLRKHYPNRTFRFKAVGGGGGKGQRLLPPDITNDQLEQHLPDLLRTVLQEVRATEPTDNQNILIELNIDSSRHQEIQLVGNGQWCVALGGRDCSVQWREQKLVEISLTQEALAAELEKCPQGEAHTEVREALTQERDTLIAMEQDAEVFGEALGLDSVSTFECLVMPEGYAFMELNARIQVEHRVTEQCYALVFSNPDSTNEHPGESFEVQSLIELMVLLARHGAQLPKPTRRLISPAAAEIRLNATDAALAPHAGGLIERWDLADDNYLWDEQGIAARTSVDHMPYRLAGAYDSNVALLVVRGADRQTCYSQLAQGLANMTLVGKDLQTNANFHQGILAWLGRDCVYPRVPTDVVAAHLRAVAHVAHLLKSIDLKAAWQCYGQRVLQGQSPSTHAAWQKALVALSNFTLRPLQALQKQPHLAYAWVCGAGAYLDVARIWSLPTHCGFIADNWAQNPMRWIAETLKIIGWLPGAESMTSSAHHNIQSRDQLSNPSDTGFWQEDLSLLMQAESFYQDLQARGVLGTQTGWELGVLAASAAPAILSVREWSQIKQRHAAYSLVLGFWQWVLTQIQVTEAPLLSLSPGGTLHEIPKWLGEWDLAAAQQILSPPPEAPDDEIVAVSGGMFYAQERPGEPPFVQPGQRFKRGDTLYIIEVMKMFNPVKAECDGVVESVLVSGMDGQVVRKGQPLFKIKPDAFAQGQTGDSVPMPTNMPMNMPTNKSSNTPDDCSASLGTVEQMKESIDKWFERESKPAQAHVSDERSATMGVN